MDYKTNVDLSHQFSDFIENLQEEQDFNSISGDSKGNMVLVSQIINFGLILMICDMYHQEDGYIGGTYSTQGAYSRAINFSNGKLTLDELVYQDLNALFILDDLHEVRILNKGKVYKTFKIDPTLSLDKTSVSIKALYVSVKE